MKPYVCPKCFKPSPGPDKSGACPICGHSTEGARLLITCLLASFIVILIVSALVIAFMCGLMF